jgi:hypothetical protein
MKVKIVVKGQILCLLLFAALTLTVRGAEPTHVIRIMSLGDSITAGYTDAPAWDVEFSFSYRIGLYNRMTNAGYDFQFVGESPEPWSGEYGLPQYIAKPDLRDLGQDHHRGYAWETSRSIINSPGIPGHNIVDWMNVDKPDVVLLMIGNVDLQGSSTDPVGSLALAETTLASLIKKMTSTWPKVHIVVALMTPFPWFEPNVIPYNDYIRNDLVPLYAQQGKRIMAVDQYSNFLTDPTDVEGINRDLLSGNHHPNPAGYDRIAQTWFEAIQAIYPTAPVSIVTPPTFLANGHFRVKYSGAPKGIYQIDRATNLTGPWEIGFARLIADDNGVFELDDPNPAAAGERFYRIADPYK